MRYVLCGTVGTREAGSPLEPALTIPAYLKPVRQIRYFGQEGVCVFATNGNPDPLIGTPGVVVVPDDLGTQIGAQAAALDALLDAAHLPHADIPPTATWIVALRRLVRQMKMWEWIGERLTGKRLNGVNLDANVMTLPQAVRDRAQEVAAHLGVTLTGGMTIRQALVAMRDAVPDGLARFDLLGIG